MKKFMTMSLTITLSSMAMAKDLFPQESFKKIDCRGEVQKELSKVFAKTPARWVKVPDFNFDTQAFRSPTAKVGEWYEIRLSENAAPTLLFYSLKETREVQWGKKCKTSSQTTAGVDFGIQNNPEVFTDASLAGIMASKKPALIYAWSPRMVYSVTEYSRVKALAEKRNIQFIPLLDPMATVAEAKAAMEKMEQAPIAIKLADRGPSSVSINQQLSSVELYMRNATLHFPSMFLVSNGKIHDRRLVGVLTNDDINESLDEMTKELK